MEEFAGRHAYRCLPVAIGNTYFWFAADTAVLSTLADSISEQAASALGVSDVVVHRIVVQKALPAKQIVKFAP